MIDTIMSDEKVAKTVKNKREERGWTQSHLAEVAGLSVRTVQRLEKEGAASKETLLAIASVLEIDVKTLTEKKVSNATKPDGKVVLLPLIENGKQALDIVWGAHAFEMDHPHVKGEDAAAVGALLESLKDMGEIGPECGLGRKIEWAQDIDSLLEDVTACGFLVFGRNKETKIITGDQKKMDFNIATVLVAERENPAVIKEGDKLFLALLVPNNRKFSFS